MENLGVFKLLSNVPLYSFIGIFIFTGILLFSPEVFIDSIGLKEYKNEYKTILGVLFLLSLSILFAKLLISLWKKFKNSIDFKKNRKIQLEYINSLTYEELTYLKPYVFDGINSQYFVVSDGVAGGLLNKGILYRSSDHGDMVNGFPYNIQPWARKALIEKNIDFNKIGKRSLTPYEEYISY